MDIQVLTDFFMWCTIINFVLYLITVIVLIFMPDFVYKVHGKFFPMARENFTMILYGFVGLYKLLFIVFNVVPFVALLIIG